MKGQQMLAFFVSNTYLLTNKNSLDMQNIVIKHTYAAKEYKPILKKIFDNNDDIEYIIKQQYNTICIYRVIRNRLTHIIRANANMFEHKQLLLETADHTSRACILQFTCTEHMLKFIVNLPIYYDYEVDYVHTKLRYYAIGNCYCSNLPKLNKFIKHALSA